MKKVFVIRTFNVLNPMEHGYMKEPASGKIPSQVKTFKNRLSAKRYLKAKSDQIRIGWAHHIIPCYLKKGGSK